MTGLLIAAGMFILTAGALASLLGWLGLLERGAEYWWGCCAAASAINAALYAMNGPRWVAPVFALGAIGAALEWRDHNRRNRRKRRALEAIGAKSRDLRDAIVRKAREAARPRTVLQPGRGTA